MKGLFEKVGLLVWLCVVAQASLSWGGLSSFIIIALQHHYGMIDHKMPRFAIHGSMDGQGILFSLVFSDDYHD
jgi:hypothetical protein